MVVPAILLLLVAGRGAAKGWGVPMATDIAFAVGVLALVGPQVPPSLRLFLLTLAVVDDVGAIVVIAFFYSSGLDVGYLMLIVGLVVVLALLNGRAWSGWLRTWWWAHSSG